MKTRKTFLKSFILLFMAIALITACKKSEMGPKGDKGDQGIAGPEGSTILSGNSSPSTTLGKNGDFYLDISAGNLYGPKTASGWGSPLSLKGSTGTAGATGNAGINGKSILSGTGIPSTGLGTDGDYYLDKTAYNFYGPKTSGNWGTPTALIGPQGPMGNANIKIDIFTVKTTDWKINGLMSTAINPNGYSVVFTKYFERSAAALTEDFINGNGLVMVYGELTPYSFLSLPYLVNDSGTPNTFFWDYRVVPGKIVLHAGVRNTTVQDVRQQVNDLTLPEAKYKIVIATGTVVSGLAAAKIDKNDKAAVAKYLGVVANSIN